ncbi:KilA-N domain-containing protein [Pantoea dispersa]|uniref:KilA-N domain-containing protein n=1 Tax=Pantoea dispersa TaxID=59814 RepID=UPI0039B4E1F6
MNQLLVVEDVSVRRDSVGRYNLNDLHHAAGGNERHSPNRWTRTESFNGLISELTPDMAFAPADIQRGRIMPATYLSKELVYSKALPFLLVTVH